MLILSFEGITFDYYQQEEEWRMDIRRSLLLLTISVASGTAAANDIGVCATCSYRTIQSAVNSAANGDLITIAAGRYTENVTIQGKSLTLQGATSGITEVDAAGRGPVFTLGTGVAGGINYLIEIHNLTIARGNHITGTLVGGGVQVRSGSYVHLYNSTITQNYAKFGAGVGIDSPGAPVSLISGCLIAGNTNSGSYATAAGFGGGISLGQGSSADIEGSSVVNNVSNDGGGIYTYPSSTLTVGNSVISGNTANTYRSPTGPDAGTGGGLETNGSVNLSGDTISQNVAPGVQGGGGAWLWAHDGDILNVSNTVITRNTLITSDNPLSEGEGGGIGILGEAAQLNLTNVYIIENQYGAGLWSDAATVKLTNTTIKDNVGGNNCSPSGCT